MKIRSEGLEPDLEKLKAAFSEISRLSAKVTFEGTSTTGNESKLDSSTS